MIIKRVSFKQLLILLQFIPLYAVSQYPFIENKGQMPTQVEAKVMLPGGVLFIESDRLIYNFYDQRSFSEAHNNYALETLNAHSYKVEYLNSKKNNEFFLKNPGDYYENYFKGLKKKWASRVQLYKHYQKNIYDGIDVFMRIENDNLKYDYIIAPYANPEEIICEYKGVNSIFLDKGKLYIKTSVNTVIEKAPYAYQIIGGKKIQVACNYHLKKQKISYVFPNGYNPKYELIIDPVLVFSTYSGSTADNFGYTATYDQEGFLYAGSTSFGIGYPTTIGAYQISFAGGSGIGGTDIVVTKYDTTGMNRIYSTYLGGDLDELPHSMIVNTSNELFVFGTTGSSNYPTTFGAFDTSFNGGTPFTPSGIGVSFPFGSDLIVSRISANGGGLLASTFIGGTGNDGLNIAGKLNYNYADEVRGEIDIDRQNNVYIASCTRSDDFPTTTNTFQNSYKDGQEGCIIKIDNQLTTIIWSSYLGGEKDDAIYSLALDNEDQIYVTGGTTSSDFPTHGQAYKPTLSDSVNADAFVTHINTNGNQILASSFYGSTLYDQSYFVEIGRNKEVYLFGQTKAIGNTLVKNANYFIPSGGQFIAILDSELTTLKRSTVVGTGKGTPDISPTAYLVDVCNRIYFSGWGSSVGGGSLSTLNLPVSYNAFQNNTDGNDFYLMVLDDSLSQLMYATYFGGSQSAEHVDGGTSRFDKKGVIYQSVCAGCGGNSDFPIEPNPGAVSSTNNSTNCNNGVFKFNMDFPMVLADFNAPWVSCDLNINFQNTSLIQGNTTYFWDFGDGVTSSQVNPTHTYLQNGLYNVKLIVSSPSSCNLVDTIVKQVYILSNSSDSLPNLTKCSSDKIQIGLLPVNSPDISYSWMPNNELSASNISNPYNTSTVSTTYQLVISNNGLCTDTLIQDIYVTEFDIDAGNDTAYCSTPILLKASSNSEYSSVLWSSHLNFSDTLSFSDTLVSSLIGNYYVKFIHEGCSEIDSVAISAENINIELSGISSICLGDTIFLKVDNLTPSYPITSFLWTPENVIYNTDSSSIWDVPLVSKWYRVEVINIQGCKISDSLYVDVYTYPSIDSLWSSDTIIYKGQSTTLYINTEDNYLWYNNYNTSSIQVSPLTDTYFKIQVFNEHCSVNDSILIQVKDVFCDEESIIIPTAFTPNDNFKNETYKIIDTESIVNKFYLAIYNRLGQRVFSSNNIFESWDGHFKGKKLPSQVLDFYVEIECVAGKRLFKKGNISLIR